MLEGLEADVGQHGQVLKVACTCGFHVLIFRDAEASIAVLSPLG
jgi:hypothetical protein